MIQSARKTILVVEDEPVVAMDLQRSLGQFGYDVPETASSAEEAFRLAEQLRPDLILMDVRISGSVDGIDAAAALRERFGVPLIYLTAYADKAAIRRAKETAPYAYLLKPVRTDELHLAVDLALQRDELERRLREREGWFSTTLRSIGDGVIAVDTSARVTFMNATAEELTGLTLADAAGRRVRDVFPLVDHDGRALPETALEKVLREGGMVDFGDVYLRREGGSPVPISDRATRVAEGERILGAVKVFRDISEQRRAQRQLLLSDRMASMGMLAASVAHEINNPLTCVLGNIELLERIAGSLLQVGLPDAGRENEVHGLFRDARESAERIRDVVRDLKIFLRSDVPDEGPTDVRKVLELSFRLAQNELRHRARIVRRYEAVPMVATSDSRLGQVLLNVIMNAAHAIPEGGARDHTIRIATSTDSAGWAVVEISDTGCGMSPAVRGRLFEPFFTTKPLGEGTGLGLSICHRIVTALGGSIEIESAEGKGTLVRIKLPPAAAAPVKQDTWRPPAVVKSSRRGRILVVDDEPTVGHGVEQLLLPEHDSVVVSGAEEALERIVRGEQFDVILCDLMMPQMTGMDLHAKLLELAPAHAARMVFMTGGAFTPRARDFLDKTSLRCLDKPFDFNELRSLMRELVAKSDRK